MTRIQREKPPPSRGGREANEEAADGECRVWVPGDPIPNRYALARDGLPARKQGSWARDKLRFLSYYESGALGATKKKRGQTHYVDLFAGPGWTVSENDRQFPGSPIRAIEARFEGKGWEGRFGRFHLCNLSEFDHGLLDARIDRLLRRIGQPDLREVVDHHFADANEAIFDIMGSIPEWAYVLCFADIEGPTNLKFTTLQELKRRHKSVDLYVLFPTGLQIQRMLPYDPAALELFAEMWTAYFGTDLWREVVLARRTDRDHGRLVGGLKDLYMDQLRSLWDMVEVRTTVRKDGHKKYDMIFATGHESAVKISRAAAREVQALNLFDGLEGGPLGG